MAIQFQKKIHFDRDRSPVGAQINCDKKYQKELDNLLEMVLDDFATRVLDVLKPKKIFPRQLEEERIADDEIEGVFLGVAIEDMENSTEYLKIEKVHQKFIDDCRQKIKNHISSLEAMVKGIKGRDELKKQLEHFKDLKVEKIVPSPQDVSLKESEGSLSKGNNKIRQTESIHFKIA